MSEHTAKAFDIDLKELSRIVAEMGGPSTRWHGAISKARNA
jgi:hypothetical protein